MIKLLAYDSLIRRDIVSLPIDFQGKTENVNFISLQLMAQINGDAPKSYFRAFGKYGFIVYSDKFDSYAVFYNEDLSVDMIRWVKCFGLAYIDLGLVKDYKTINLRESAPDTFAFYFSCPDTVLESCEICTAEDIIKYCCIPFHKARKKAEYISNERYTSKTTLDESILKKFDTFIDFFKKML